MITRRQWIAGIAGAALAGVTADAFAIEPDRLEVTRHHVGVAGGPMARIIQLTDLHLQSVGRHEERIASAVAALHPDLILITGDSIDRADRLGVLDDFLSLLDAPTPKLAILGNWGHWARVDLTELARIYAEHDCRLLRNESTEFHLGDTTLLITGLDDLVGGTPDLRAAIAGATPQPNHLLLAHCPLHRDLVRADARAIMSGAASEMGHIDVRLLAPQLMLAGHTHGGQIAPFGWAPFVPPGSGRYVRGWYRNNPIPLYVSRGLGTSTVHARLGSVPEVAYFEWGLAAP